MASLPRLPAGIGALGTAILTGQPFTSSDSSQAPSPGWVSFAPWSADDVFDALYVKTSGEPTIPTADPGFETVQRAQRIATTPWRGGNPLRQDIPVVMNVLAFPDLDVQDEWDALTDLWRPAGGAQPPTIRIAGPVSRPDVPWVIIDLQTDADMVKRRGNRLVRVEATVSLLQFVTPALSAYAPDSAKNKAAKQRPRSTISKEGDTLKTIARRPPPDGLGDGHKWTVLQKLNPTYKTANQKIPAGTQIRLPNG